jgi:hypothetical protein
MKVRVFLVAAALLAAAAGGAFAGSRVVRAERPLIAQLGSGFMLLPVQYGGERPGAERLRIPPRLHGGRPPPPPFATPHPPPLGGRLLPDAHIWALVQRNIAGRIVAAHLRGPIYSFRIISRRGNIVDVDVDRYTGRLLSVRGGP